MPLCGSHPVDVTDPGGFVHVCTPDTEANTGNVTGRGDAGTRVSAYGAISHATAGQKWQPGRVG